MDELDDSVNFKALQNELVSAVEKDKTYQEQNDAKFRAIHQKVRSYDEFRDIVEASHLKPLEKNDKVGGMPYQKWNVVSDSKERRSGPGEQESEESVSAETFPTPKTLQEFTRTWSRQCKSNEAKFSYIMSISPDDLRKLLALECPVGEIVTVLNACADMEKHGNAILVILETVTLCKRFKLQLNFLQASEINELSNLLHHISQWQQYHSSEKQISLTLQAIYEKFNMECDQK